MRRARGVQGARLLACLMLACFALTIASPAQAQKKAPNWAANLEPRTRTIQLCNFAGLTAFSRDKALKPKADRVRVNASSEPKIEASLVTGRGGAVRSGQRWYAFTFKCTLSDDGMKTASFTYEIGKEIPKGQWEKLGLWE